MLTLIVNSKRIGNYLWVFYFRLFVKYPCIRDDCDSYYNNKILIKIIGCDK